jgi:ATP-dependent DNA helicase DinG
MREAAEHLVGKIDFPILVQGDAPRTELLDLFRKTRHAVLLGTSSFWEGVDVRGQALSCVIIDKLPFAAPDDPVLQARLRRLEEQGGSPFMDYQIPEAVISLKQGVGRLIRDRNDYGVLMLCDPRLKTKAYGRIFIKSLPDVRYTSELAEVEAFFRAHERAGE